MNDKDIKQAIDKQLENIDMNPYLKEKTMTHIAMKSAHSKRLKRQFLTVSGLSAMALLVGVMLPKQPKVEIEPMSIAQHSVEESSVEAPQPTRMIESEDSFSGLMLQLNNFKISYEVESSYSQSGVNIYKITIDDTENYFLQVDSSSELNRICEVLNEMFFSITGNGDTVNKVKFNEYNYFIYSTSHEGILNYLNSKTEAAFCE